MLRLSALYRFPLKSAMGESLERAQLDALGLVGDRRWMLVDADNGRFLSQRLLPRMTQLAAHCGAGGGLILSAAGLPDLEVPLPDGEAAMRGVFLWSDSLYVPDAGDAAAQWLSRFTGRPCRLVQIPAERARWVEGSFEVSEKVGFADGFPLHLIARASLDDLCARVGRPLEMSRFRPNLVVEGSEPYAEDNWKRIRIGDIEMRVMRGCNRCVIPNLDPDTGERSADHEPLKTLKSYRQRHGEVYFGQYLVNEGGGELQLGMPVEVLE